METLLIIIAVIVVAVIAFVAWSMSLDKTIAQSKNALVQSLNTEFGRSDLSEIFELELQPAVEAHKSGDLYAVTALFSNLMSRLTLLALRTFGNDFFGRNPDFTSAKRDFQIEAKNFLQEHNLFEPSTPISLFGGSKSIEELGYEIVPSGSIKFGSDWVALGAEIFPLVAVTDVEVYTDGQKYVNYTSRPSVGSALIGSVLPGSSLLWAMARPKVNRIVDDDRESCIMVIGEDFELELPIDPDKKKDAKVFARQLQNQVELAKGTRSEKSSPISSRDSNVDIPRENAVQLSLERLTMMYADGLLTAEEFSRLKAKLNGDSE